MGKLVQQIKKSDEQAARQKKAVHDKTPIKATKSKRDGVRQFSVHLQENTHRKAKIALLLQGAKQYFSGLVEQLLAEYLAPHKTKEDIKLPCDR